VNVRSLPLQAPTGDEDHEQALGVRVRDEARRDPRKQDGLPGLETPHEQAPREDWPRDDWRAQLQHAVTCVADLDRLLGLSTQEREGAERAAHTGLPLAVTPYYLSLIDPRDPDCPIRRQVIPHRSEAELTKGDLVDPLGEVAHEVAPHLVQRYPDRCLLLASDRCSVYCRFCTRSRMVGSGGGARSLAQLAGALAYLRSHPEISDVIISGGDPLVMATERLVRLISAVREIESVQTIRLATRTPVTLPQRITDELLSALRPHHPLWVMTHFNHPRELTAQSRQACERLADAGFPVLNQTVLLRGINDNAEVLTQLFRGLVRVRVRPYYLLQMDPVVGTGHLRTTVATGQAIMRQLQGRLSGIALPKYIIDAPGGLGKVPAGPSFIERQADGVTRLSTPRGTAVDYYDPPS